jgi:hypothetical protein
MKMQIKSIQNGSTKLFKKIVAGDVVGKRTQVKTY